MRVPHYAKRSLAVLALAAVMAGCGGGDSTGPNDAPFDAAGTSSDVEAVGNSFDSPALEAYASASTYMSAVVGGSAAVAMRAAPSASLVQGGKAGAIRYGTALSRDYVTFRRAPSPSTAAAEIPAEYAGKTFVWDVETDQYVASDLPGAPSNGVRFLLYAVDPVTGEPVEPLVPIDGYAQLTMTETSSSATVRITVVSSDVTYLDYSAVLSGNASSATITISGFATNGTDRVDFDLDTQLSDFGADGLTLAMDYELNVPTRGGFLLDLEATLSGLGTESPQTTIDLLARGDHGTVRIDGSATEAGGSFDVTVNGDHYATITIDAGGQDQVAGADGQPLGGEELDAVVSVYNMFGSGLDFFYDLTGPIA
jgi:hypothetical protein